MVHRIKDTGTAAVSEDHAQPSHDSSCKFLRTSGSFFSRFCLKINRICLTYTRALKLLQAAAEGSVPAGEALTFSTPLRLPRQTLVCLYHRSTKCDAADTENNTDKSVLGGGGQQSNGFSCLWFDQNQPSLAPARSPHAPVSPGPHAALQGPMQHSASAFRKLPS